MQEEATLLFNRKTWEKAKDERGNMYIITSEPIVRNLGIPAVEEQCFVQNSLLFIPGHLACFCHVTYCSLVTSSNACNSYTTAWSQFSRTMSRQKLEGLQYPIVHRKAGSNSMNARRRAYRRHAQVTETVPIHTAESKFFLWAGTLVWRRCRRLDGIWVKSLQHEVLTERNLTPFKFEGQIWVVKCTPDLSLASCYDWCRHVWMGNRDIPLCDLASLNWISRRVTSSPLDIHVA